MKRFLLSCLGGLLLLATQAFTPCQAAGLVRLSNIAGPVRIESWNFPGRFVRHFNSRARIDSDVNPLADSEWRVVAGLADGGAISFQSVNFPGYFLRHQNSEISIVKDDGSALFHADATFRIVNGLKDGAAISFQSYNFPGSYIRHANSLLRIDPINSDLDRQDATFRFRDQAPLNPLYIGAANADPSLIRVGATYYSAESQYGAVLCLRQANSAAGILTATPRAILKNPVNFADMWAPELLTIDGRFYIYYAANNGADHRMFVISAASMDGPWSDPTSVALPDDRWAIDGTAFRYNNQLWFVWSGWAGSVNGEQNLYICRMSSPSQSTGARFIISQPRESWEMLDNPRINEGPEAIVDPNGQLHIVYSANGSWGANYGLADLRLRAGGDPTYVWDWFKSNGSLFCANASIMMPGWSSALYYKGVGHHSFVLLNGDISTSPPAGPTFPLGYHGVRMGDNPSDFWGARTWKVGSFCWWGNVKYTRGSASNTGWSLKFFE